MRRALALACAITMLVARPASAQLFEASANAFTLQNHSRFASARHEQTGQWVGGEASFEMSQVRITLAGGLGGLTGEADSSVADRTGRFTSVTVSYVPKSWISVGGVAEAKVFKTDVGTRAWRLLGAQARLTPELDQGTRGRLEGLLDVTVWPSAAVIGGESMPTAMRVLIGATYRLANSPFGIRVAYRFERFDFEGDAASAQLEQFRGAMAALTFRLGR